MSLEKFSLADLDVTVGKQSHVTIPKKIISEHNITPHDMIIVRIRRADRVDIASFHARMHATNNSIVIPKVLIDHFDLKHGDSLTLSLVKILKDVVSP